VESGVRSAPRDEPNAKSEKAHGGEETNRVAT
jgi:hypothetical protein